MCFYPFLNQIVTGEGLKMHKSIKISLLLAVLMLFCINPAAAIPYQVGNFDPVRPNQDYWTCYDHSINYARENPEWGVVVVSHHPHFRYGSHMVNYKIENDTIHFYDSTWSTETKQYDYYVNIDDRKTDNPYFSPCYYKFCLPEKTPIRQYVLFRDNSQVWLNNV